MFLKDLLLKFIPVKVRLIAYIFSALGALLGFVSPHYLLYSVFPPTKPAVVSNGWMQALAIIILIALSFLPIIYVLVKTFGKPAAP